MLATMSRLLFACAALYSLLPGCDCAGPMPVRCTTSSDCRGGAMCIDGACIQPLDAGRPDAAPDAPPSIDAGVDAFCAEPCGAACCASDERCFAGTTECIR